MTWLTRNETPETIWQSVVVFHTFSNWLPFLLSFGLDLFPNISCWAWLVNLNSTGIYSPETLNALLLDTDTGSTKNFAHISYLLQDQRAEETSEHLSWTYGMSFSWKGPNTRESKNGFGFGGQNIGGIISCQKTCGLLSSKISFIWWRFKGWVHFHCFCIFNWDKLGNMAMHTTSSCSVKCTVFHVKWECKMYKACFCS